MNRLEEIVLNQAEMLATLKDVPKKVDSMEQTLVALKDVPTVIAEWRQSPSLTWLVRHKPKEMAIITAGVIALSVFIGFPGTYMAERLQLAIELLFAKWLKL